MSKETKAKLTYQPREFIGREDEIDDIGLAVERIKTLGSISQTLYEFYGSPGIGKSALTRQIETNLHLEKIPTSVVDFNPNDNKRADQYTNDPTLLIEDMLTFLPEENQKGIHELIITYRESDSDSCKLDNVSRGFQRYIYSLARENPVVLMFDSTEQVQERTSAYLEEWIINPLLQNGRVLITWTGRRPQRWKRFEVRRRVRISEMVGLTSEETDQLFNNDCLYEDASELFKSMQSITLGHPAINSLIIDNINQWGRQGGNFDVFTLPEQQRKLIELIKDEYIDKVVFERIDAPMVKRGLELISLVRQFDVVLFKRVLEAAGEFDDFSRNEFGTLLGRLRESQILMWDDEKKGYVIIPEFRHVLRSWFAQQELKTFIIAQRATIDELNSWIQKSGGHEVYVLEKIYHHAHLLQATHNTGDSTPPSLSEVVEESIALMPKDKDKKASRLDKLIKRIEKDEEFIHLIGNSEFQALLEQLKEARKSIYYK